MKRFSLFLVFLLLASGCSIIRNNKNQLISDYSIRNFFIESAYTSYYKAAKWHNRGISVNLYDSEYLENPCDKQVFTDTTNFTFPQEKIIGIADNRRNYYVQVKLLDGMANLIKDTTTYVNIYNRQDLLLKEFQAHP